MPYLKIQTNTGVDEGTRKEILQKASSLISSHLGKPEKFFMGALEPDVEMIFDGSDSPLAFLELRALGLPGPKTKDLCRELCALVEEKLEISKERVYVKFLDVNRGMWGWNGELF